MQELLVKFEVQSLVFTGSCLESWIETDAGKACLCQLLDSELNQKVRQQHY